MYVLIHMMRRQMELRNETNLRRPKPLAGGLHSLLLPDYSFFDLFILFFASAIGFIKKNAEAKETKANARVDKTNKESQSGQKIE